jgi:hypothetical protein
LALGSFVFQLSCFVLLQSVCITGIQSPVVLLPSGVLLYFHGMRALLDLDEKLLAAAEREAARRGQTLSALIELALSTFVTPNRGTKPSPARASLPTFRGQGLRPGVNLDDSAALLELMESPHAAD